MTRDFVEVVLQGLVIGHIGVLGGHRFLLLKGLFVSPVASYAITVTAQRGRAAHTDPRNDSQPRLNDIDSAPIAARLRSGALIGFGPSHPDRPRDLAERVIAAVSDAIGGKPGGPGVLAFGRRAT